MDITLFEDSFCISELWFEAYAELLFEAYAFLYRWLQDQNDLVLLLLLMVVVLVGGLLNSIVSQELRMRALTRSAKALDLSFKTCESSKSDAFLNQFRRFLSSSNCRNVMEGRLDEIDILIGDSYFKKGSSNNDGGNNTGKVYFSFIAFASDQLKVPEFSMSPETWFCRLLEGISTHLTGEGDIDFPDHPKFSENYRLSGPDEASIRKFFNSRLLEHFEAHTEWNVHAINGGIIFYRSSGRVHPKNLQKFLDEGLFMLQAIMP